MNGRATTWGVFKAYAFFFIKLDLLSNEVHVSHKNVSHHRPYAISYYLTYLYRQSFFTYALFKMLTTLLKQTFQNGGKSKEQQKVSNFFQDKHLFFCLCPPSLKNDLNNVAGIDDFKD